MNSNNHSLTNPNYSHYHRSAFPQLHLNKHDTNYITILFIFIHYYILYQLQIIHGIPKDHNPHQKSMACSQIQLQTIIHRQKWYFALHLRTFRKNRRNR